MDEKGFSLTELMVGIVIGAIVLLMVGALSQVSFGSFNKLRAEAYVDDDAYFALDLIQHAVRHHPSTATWFDTGGSVVSTGIVLKCDGKTFSWTSGSPKDLVYTEGATTQKLIFGVDPSSSVTSSLSGNVVTINLTVNKRIRASDSQLTVFSYSVKATRRNP